MSKFGLVHGGGLGSWCWELLIPELETRGHEAATVDLPLDDGSAGSLHFAEMVLEAFAGFDDLVLVGHSVAGLIIPLAASRRPPKRLVYLHAALPKPGRSYLDQVAAEPDMFNPEMLTLPPTWWSDEATVTRFFFHDCPHDIARDAFRRVRPPAPRALWTEVTPMRAWPDVLCSYILCLDDRTATPAWARRAASESLGVEPIEIPGGHCPMLSRPGPLADALLQGP